MRERLTTWGPIAVQLAVALLLVFGMMLPYALRTGGMAVWVAGALFVAMVTYSVGKQVRERLRDRRAASVSKRAD